MDLSKNAITAVGGLAVGVILVAGGLFVAKPQFHASSDYQNRTAVTVNGRANQIIKLKSLKAQQGDLPQLQQQVADLQAQLPGSDDLEDIARLVVGALDDGDNLVSLQHRSMTVLTPAVPPTVSLSDPVSVFPEEAAEAPATGGSTTTAATGPPQLQQIPLIITVDTPTLSALQAYLDKLAAGPRLLLVLQVETTSSSNDEGSHYESVIYAYAFADAPLPASAADPSSTTTTPPTSG